MPQAAIIAGIGAAAQIGGAVVGSRAASGASKAQLKANENAINYERERQRQADDRMRAYNDEYKKSYLDWYGRVGDEGLKRFGAPPVGVQLPGATRAQAPAVRMGGSSVAAPMAAAPMAPMSPAPMGGAAPLAPQAPQVGMQPAGQLQQGATASLSGWEDWNRYPIGA